MSAPYIDANIARGFGVRYGKAYIQKNKIAIKHYDQEGKRDIVSHNKTIVKAGLAGQRGAFSKTPDIGGVK
jgi:hypothetical protein